MTRAQACPAHPSLPVLACSWWLPSALPQKRCRMPAETHPPFPIPAPTPRSIYSWWLPSVRRSRKSRMLRCCCTSWMSATPMLRHRWVGLDELACCYVGGRAAALGWGGWPVRSRRCTCMHASLPKPNAD